MKPKITIIGAGFAGMAAAEMLNREGFQVTLLEKNPVPGGRCLSFKDPLTGDWLDAGQHLLMGCYTETLDFLEKIGARDRLESQPLRLEWLSPGGKRHVLDASGRPWRLSTLMGFLKLSTLSGGDKFRLLKAFYKIKNLSEPEIQKLDHLSCQQWLSQLGQSRRAIENFWHPLLVSTLNEETSRASAAGLAIVIRQGLLSGPEASQLFLPEKCLLDLYHPALEHQLAAGGGQLLLKTRAERLQIKNDLVQGVETQSGEFLQTDFLICALPAWTTGPLFKKSGIEKCLPEKLLEPALGYSPIVTVYLWTTEEMNLPPVAGLLEGPFHWIFRRSWINPETGEKGSRLALVSSAARRLVSLPASSVKQEAISVMQKYYLGFSPDRVKASRVVTDRKATPSFTPGFEKYRPGPQTSIKNLFLAGDWTDSGLPATIEGAVRSGRKAARAVIKWVKEDSIGSFSRGGKVPTRREE